MYSGLLPEGLTEDDLSPDDDEEEEGDAAETMTGGEKSESAEGKLNSGEDTRANSAAGDAHIEYPTCSLPGISQEMWQVCQLETL